tara:strand:- start:613 stop:861 length:249 start_codon:yes stop_codon:yes gene_type:complete
LCAEPKTITKSWEELGGNILVDSWFIGSGKWGYVYYRMGKQNDKSAWLSRCSESGEIYSAYHPDYEHMRWHRQKVPRKVLVV